MTTQAIRVTAPQPDEYNPYYGRYISLVSSEDIVTTLAQQLDQTRALLGACGEKAGDFRYAPEKWSLKEVLGHVIDTERVFGYRALRIARNDKTPMEGFEQDDYIRFGPFQQCRLSDLVEELSAVRQGTLCFFRNLDGEAWTRRGIANKDEISVRAIAYILAGHELHHRNVMKEKYLAKGAAQG